MRARIDALLAETVSQLSAIDPERTQNLLSYKNRSLDLLKVIRIPRENLEDFKFRYQNAKPEQLNNPSFYLDFFNPQHHIQEPDLTDAEILKRNKFNEVLSQFLLAAINVIKEENQNIRLSELPPEILATFTRPFSNEQYHLYADELMILLRYPLNTNEDFEALEKLVEDPHAKLDTLLYERIRKGLLDNDPEIRRITRACIIFSRDRRSLYDINQYIKQYKSLLFDENYCLDLSNQKFYYNEGTIFRLCPIIANSLIRKLNMSHTDIGHCPTDVIPAVIDAIKTAVNLIEVDLSDVQLGIFPRIENIQNLLTGLASTNVRLLNLNNNYLSGYFNDVIYKALLDSKLMHLNLSENHFNKDELTTIISNSENNYYLQQLIIDGLDEDLTKQLSTVLERNKKLNVLEYDQLLGSIPEILNVLAKKYDNELSDESRAQFVKKASSDLANIIAAIDKKISELTPIDNKKAKEMIDELKKQRDYIYLKAAEFFHEHMRFKKAAKAFMEVSPLNSQFANVRFQAFDLLYSQCDLTGLTAVMPALLCLINNNEFIHLTKDDLKIINGILFKAVGFEKGFDQARSLSEDAHIDLLKWALIKTVWDKLSNLPTDRIQFTSLMSQRTLGLRDKLSQEDCIQANPKTFDQFNNYREDIKRIWDYVRDRLQDTNLDSDEQKIFIAVNKKYESRLEEQRQGPGKNTH